MAELGLFIKWKQLYWPRLWTCQPPDQAKAMGLDDLQGAFYIFFGIMGVAVCILIIEITFHCIKTSTSRWPCLTKEDMHTILTGIINILLSLFKRRQKQGFQYKIDPIRSAPDTQGKFTNIRGIWSTEI